MTSLRTNDDYLTSLLSFVQTNTSQLLDQTLILKLNPSGLRYVQSRLSSLSELESLLSGAPVDYLRAYVSDLGDHRALEQLRRILRLLTSLKVVSGLERGLVRDPTPMNLTVFGRLRVLELRGCDLSTSAAKGLLELRHSLEKLICHNSTDALRHVFASRIAEIKDSPQWNHLQFVSCAQNNLVLMDESLQLLPVVETLDLSRNKFARVDNLQKCSGLKHLDLGFNHMRTVSSLSEVSPHIVKLVLRNNALTTLRGIENLKSLEGLDLSYNIISNFTELEFLAGLPYLHNLWLEGNPFCCARWYRAQVFSFFLHPEKLILDDKNITKREFWNRQIIVASRQKRPASFGFYAPLRADQEHKGSINTRKKTQPRLAYIENDEQSNACSDQESVSCVNENESREENTKSDDETEIADLINKVELMKKERSVLWLRDFKEWMDQDENLTESSAYTRPFLGLDKKNYTIRNKTSHNHFGESSRYVSDIQTSGDEYSTNILDSDSSYMELLTHLHAHEYSNEIGSETSKLPLENIRRGPMTVTQKMDTKHDHSSYYMNERVNVSSKLRKLPPINIPSQLGDRTDSDISGTVTTSFDDIMETLSLSAFPRSPPQYKKDILHRRQNMVEEILQLSTESLSVESSDSNTSCSEDDICESDSSVFDVDQSLDEVSACNANGPASKVITEDNYYDRKDEVPQVRENGDGCAACSNVGEILGKKHRRKPKRRVVSLLQQDLADGEVSQELSGNLVGCSDGETLLGKVADTSEIQRNCHDNEIFKTAVTTGVRWKNSTWTDDSIVDYFNLNFADSQVNEISQHFVRCNCLVGQEPREVIIILSSECSLCVLQIDVTFNGPDTLRLMGRHRVEDVREVLVGMGLHLVRVCIGKDASYLFVTRNVENARELFCALQAVDSHEVSHNCYLRSLDQVQVDFFEKQICGGSKLSIFQYSMVLFCRKNNGEESWLSRSLLVVHGHLLVCIEDVMQFGAFSVDANSCPYFSLDSCCCIADVSEMVIEASENQCVTLALECTSSEFLHSAPADITKEVEAKKNRKTTQGSLTWKLKWFSEDSIFKFAAILKAIHAGMTMSPLLVKYVS